ncbi:hypothetical protein ACFOLJ_05540 [Rugamonas sp. CCM 8940]|nr:hypothetical protein [Rugamonas sp. CCM 8940]MBJ7312813.1 hypothetical protein [Rugamonas sp. CCM 8940]
MIEALVAFFLLVFIVWWTMYSGKTPARPSRALPDPRAEAQAKQPPDQAG